MGANEQGGHRPLCGGVLLFVFQTRSSQGISLWFCALGGALRVPLVRFWLWGNNLLVSLMILTYSYSNPNRKIGISLVTLPFNKSFPEPELLYVLDG